jgi:hypothetical protein
MPPIHERMPVTLKPSDYNRWLDRSITDQPRWMCFDLTTPTLCRPLPVTRSLVTFETTAPRSSTRRDSSIFRAVIPVGIRFSVFPFRRGTAAPSPLSTPPLREAIAALTLNISEGVVDLIVERQLAVRVRRIASTLHREREGQIYGG